jgi:twitching motility protein PilT
MVGLMSAIVSLLRVMTLRDAEAITLEGGKIPSLRRRGQVEPMAMPALDAGLVEDFAAPLVEGKALEAGPVMVTFVDPEGTTYPVTVEKVGTSLRLTVRKPAPPKPKPAPAPVARPAPTAATTPAGASTSPGAAVPGGPSAAAVARLETTAIEHDAAAARPRIAQLLATAIAIAKDRGASDVVLSTGQSPRIRAEGRVEPIDLQIDDEELAACASLFAGAVGINGDLGLDIDNTRVRVNVFDHLGGYGLVARLIRDTVPTLAQLDLPHELASIVELRDGLVLVCGPTGSGKSTTLAALLDVLDQRRAAHVITLEDPIEYRFHPRRCLVHQRELGTHIPSFAAGLRAALREAPDVILLGELRDRDTIAAALTAAETGHLVLATLHAPSAAGAIDRVIDVFPESGQRQIRNQLAGSLRTIVTQYLLPRRDGGRAVAVELVPVTPAVCNIIRKGDLHTLPTAIQSGRDAGMIPLERSLAKLLDAGTVAPKVVQRIAADHDLLQSLASRLR